MSDHAFVITSQLDEQIFDYAGRLKKIKEGDWVEDFGDILCQEDVKVISFLGILLERLATREQRLRDEYDEALRSIR